MPKVFIRESMKAPISPIPKNSVFSLRPYGLLEINVSIVQHLF